MRPYGIIGAQAHNAGLKANGITIHQIDYRTGWEDQLLLPCLHPLVTIKP
jgi:hypothetical protein